MTALYLFSGYAIDRGNKVPSLQRCLSSVNHCRRPKNAASANMPAKDQTQLTVEQESVRGNPSMSTIIPCAADDMAPFLEQLQGGEGGDLHEVIQDTEVL